MATPEVLEQMWIAHAPAVWAYAARRAGRVEADDVVSRVFVVAARTKDLEAVQDQRAWLVGVARNVLRGDQRSSRRRAALRERLGRVRSETFDSPDVLDASVVEALRSLPERDRELLLLIAWDGFDIAGAGVVLSLSPGAARMRLMRARKRLVSYLELASPQGSEGT